MFDVWRNDRTIYELCQHYHYDGEAKNLGSENGTFDITDGYIETIDKIQKKLMLQICEKGICIECNPSSNLVIGTFRRMISIRYLRSIIMDFAIHLQIGRFHRNSAFQ